MIPFLDLKKINEPYETAFQEKLKSVLENGWYIIGKEVETFEKAFSSETSGWNNLSFPITEKIHKEVLSLPMNPVLTESELDYIIEILNQY